MRAFPIQDSELNDLFALSRNATISFALASGFLGFSIDLIKDLVLTNGLSVHVFWVSAIVSVLVLLIGLYLVKVGNDYIRARGTKVQEIKDATEFDDA